MSRERERDAGRATTPSVWRHHRRPVILALALGALALGGGPGHLVPIGEPTTRTTWRTSAGITGHSSLWPRRRTSPDTGYEMSRKFMYDINTKNTDTKYVSGKEFHFDYAVAQQAGNWALGVGGAYYQENGTDDKAGGATVEPDGNKGSSSVSLGPQIGYQHKNMTFIAQVPEGPGGHGQNKPAASGSGSSSLSVSDLQAGFALRKARRLLSRRPARCRPPLFLAVRRRTCA